MENLDELSKLFEIFFKGKIFKKNKNITLVYKITREQARKGMEKEITINRTSVCEECKGEGSIEGKPCRECYTYGYKYSEEKLIINIPQRIKDNTVILLREQGNQFKENESRGNVYIKIHVYGKKRMRRKVILI